MKKFAVSFIFSLMIFCSVAGASELKGIWLNHEGVRAYTEERSNDSYNYFAKSLAEMPFSPEAHFNLGASYFMNKEFEKAQKEFEQAAILAKKAGSPVAEFASHFNAGVAATEAKQVDVALDAYQKALLLQPASVEVKTNIELLTASQSGGDGGENKEQKDDGDKGKQEPKPGEKPNQPQPNQQQKPQPKPFDSKEMSQQDVNRIVEELKRQEEQIRAKFQNEKMKSAPNDKDW